MKTIPIEQLNERLTLALEQQNEREAIGLTKDADTVAWVLRVPKEFKDADADVVAYNLGPDGHVVVIMQAKHPAPSQRPQASPVFGAGRGTLTVIRDDNDHLNDFLEYMK